MVQEATAPAPTERRTDIPTTVLLTSWIYDDLERSRAKATAFFRDVRASLDVLSPTCPFPFAGPWEIALLNAREYWAVAVWGAWPDRGEVLDDILTWEAACGAKDQGFVDRDLRAVAPGDAWADVLPRGSGVRVVERFGGTAERTDARRIGVALGRA